MTEYATDVPDINEETTYEDLIKYTERRMENPIQINGTTIWDFNSHEPDRDALKKAVDEKLARDKYVIPFQVTGAWTFICGLLPEPVREAEILIYRTSMAQYYAYENYYRELPEESRQRIKQDFAEIVRKQ